MKGCIVTLHIALGALALVGSAMVLLVNTDSVAWDCSRKCLALQVLLL